MKHMVSLLLVGMLVLGGLGAAALTDTTVQPTIRTESLLFSPPVIQQKEDACAVSIPNANAWLRQTNAPLLPAVVNTYIFPFGTTIHAVEVTFSQPHQYQLDQQILRSPAPVTTIGTTTQRSATEHQPLGDLYPETLFEYHLGAGLSSQGHALYLTVRCYPIQYQADTNTILYRDSASLSISYELPAMEPTAADEYQLIIIAPQLFSDALQPLVDHKISNSVTTKLVTLNEIYTSTYFPVEGRDCAEEVKYFIKNAYDTWGIQYVLLVGGRYGGIMNEKWWVPVRYTNLDDDQNWEGGYLSDLYFADLYDAYGNFSSWDSNNNDLFAEWNSQGKDILDMYPEVSVGRLACKSLREVRTLVNKITTYETTTAGQPWFHDMVVVGGDSAPIDGDPWFEGEEENKLALEYMADFTGIKLWTSTGNFTGPQDVIDAINAGCGFLFFDGHGNPMSWSTHPPHNETIWINGLQVKDMPKLTNADKLPITVCGGCHNGQFNTSLLNILKGLIKEKLKYFSWTFYLGEWTPACWAWKLMSVPKGGSIATMAYTGLDWFAEGDYNTDGIPDCVQFLSGYANTKVFYNYGVNNKTMLGQAHTQALIDYLTTFPPMNDKLDCKTVQEFVLLGDPSLHIGGYP
ncbi:MAG: hypothetical protein JXA00_01450 [Candidatus Thermoplasmatota archaeon]|nr:hypothetical protein [Candidatus Thermoplasmatota archaeon]